MDELQRVLERQVRELAGGVLGQPQSSALDRSAEPDVRVGLGGQERMFSCDRRSNKKARRGGPSTEHTKAPSQSSSSLFLSSAFAACAMTLDAVNAGTALSARAALHTRA